MTRNSTDELIERQLLAILQDDHERLKCGARYAACECGYEARKDGLIERAASELTALRTDRDLWKARAGYDCDGEFRLWEDDAQKLGPQVTALRAEVERLTGDVIALQRGLAEEHRSAKAAQADLARAVGALEPFAAEFESWDDLPPDDEWFFIRTQGEAEWEVTDFSVGDLRRAASVLADLGTAAKGETTADLDAPLPCRIDIGPVSFAKGVKLRTFVEAARRWYDKASDHTDAVSLSGDANPLPGADGVAAQALEHAVIERVAYEASQWSKDPANNPGFDQPSLVFARRFAFLLAHQKERA